MYAVVFDMGPEFVLGLPKVPTHAPDIFDLARQRRYHLYAVTDDLLPHLPTLAGLNICRHFDIESGFQEAGYKQVPDDRKPFDYLDELVRRHDFRDIRVKPWGGSNTFESHYGSTEDKVSLVVFHPGMREAVRRMMQTEEFVIY